MSANPYARHGPGGPQRNGDGDVAHPDLREFGVAIALGRNLRAEYPGIMEHLDWCAWCLETLSGVRDRLAEKARAFQEGHGQEEAGDGT